MALSSEQRRALANERFARLKAALSLNSGQEKNWPAVEAALLDAARARLKRGKELQDARVKQTRGGGGVNLAERFRARAEGLRSRAALVQKFADATAPFLASLDDAQKRRFGEILRASSRRRLEAIAAQRR